MYRLVFVFAALCGATRAFFAAGRASEIVLAFFVLEEDLNLPFPRRSLSPPGHHLLPR